jgi:hypothetical protein
MPIYPQDVAIAKSQLWSDETIQVTATERRIGPGGSLITPTTIVITDKRLLIVNRATLGLRRDVESIPYSSIASVRLEKGLISYSVFIRVSGYSSPGERGFLKSGEQEGEISGLHKADAKAIADYIERVTSGYAPVQPPQAQSQPYSGQGGSAPSGGSGGYSYCNKCGAKNPMNAKFCSGCGAKLT